MLAAEDRVVVVGASLAGLRTAEALRGTGFTGQIVLVGDETHAPYDRPALSKAVLAGRIAPTALGLPATRSDLDAKWRLGVRATGLDPHRRVVRLADGSDLGYDALVVATGRRARPWPDPRQAALRGVLTVRTLDDAAELQALLAAPNRRVVVMGAGFIGSEVASVAHELGHAVTVVDRGHGPMVHALGRPAGDLAAELQRAAGIDLRTSTAVVGLDGADGHVVAAHLSDGDRVAADVVVVALGAVCNVEWLGGSGLVADGDGVLCDLACRVRTDSGTPDDRIVAVGDLLRWPHPLLDGRPVTVEHWGNAVESATVAAHTLAHGPDSPIVHDTLPAFWSNQFGSNIKSVGLPREADQVAVVQGDVGQRRFVAAYGRSGRMIGAVAMDMPRELDGYRALISCRAAFPPTLAVRDAPERIRIHPTSAAVDGHEGRPLVEVPTTVHACPAVR